MSVGHDSSLAVISAPNSCSYPQRRLKYSHLHFSLSVRKAIFTEVLQLFHFAMQSYFALQVWFSRTFAVRIIF